jgi:hypothetical protein
MSIEGLAYVLNSPYGSWLSWRNRKPRRTEGASSSEALTYVRALLRHLASSAGTSCGWGVPALFTTHRYRIRNRRHRGNIGAFVLLDSKATLVPKGDCWLNSRGWI